MKKEYMKNVEQMKEGLEDKVKEFVKSSEELKNFIEFYRKHFRFYSARNLMLIYSYNRMARFITGFKKWKELGYKVKKGEKARYILAPVKNKNDEEVERFIHVPVFDDSQVEPTEKAVPFPKINTDYKAGESQWNINSVFYATKRVIENELGKIIHFYEDQDSFENGFTDGTKICIKKRNRLGMLGTMIHEYIHFKKHYDDNRKKINLNKNECELEAEMGSIIFGSIFNFEIENKYNYLHSYQDKKTKLSTIFEKVLPFSSQLADKVLNELGN